MNYLKLLLLSLGLLFGHLSIAQPGLQLSEGFEIADILRYSQNNILFPYGTGKLWLNKFNGDVLLSNNSFGLVGVNTASVYPPNAKLTIQKGADKALYMYEEGDNTIQWGFEVNGHLNFYINSDLQSFFDKNSGDFVLSSDRRLKTNITALNNGILSQLMQLKAKTYYYKNDPIKDQKSIGYMAQEVEKIFPETVQSPQNETDFYTLDYTQIGVLMVKGIQEFKSEIDQQENLIRTNETALDLLAESIRLVTH